VLVIHTRMENRSLLHFLVVLRCFSVTTWIILAIMNIAFMVEISKIEGCNDTHLQEETSNVVEITVQVVCEIYNSSIDFLTWIQLCWLIFLLTCIVNAFGDLFLLLLLLLERFRASSTKKEQLY